MTRRLIALVCVALVVLATVAPGSTHVSDVLEPLSAVLHPVVSLVVAAGDGTARHEQPVSYLSSHSPRPPPISPTLV
jgi:hypothetical protein